MFLFSINAVLSCEVIKRSLADCLKLNFSFILISFLTDLTPSVSHATLVNFSFSSGSSTFPVKKFFHRELWTLQTKNNFYLEAKFSL